MEAVLEGLEDDLVNVLPALGDAPTEDDLRPYLAWIAHWALDACDADIDVCSETGELVAECERHDACEAVAPEAYDYAVAEVEMKADLLRDHDLPDDYARAVAAFVGMAGDGRAIWSEPAVAQASGGAPTIPMPTTSSLASATTCAGPPPATRSPSAAPSRSPVGGGG